MITFCVYMFMVTFHVENYGIDPIFWFADILIMLIIGGMALAQNFDNICNWFYNKRNASSKVEH